MSEKNVQTVRDFITAGNEGGIDRIRSFLSDGCVYKGTPYVGCGFNIDDSDGKRVLVSSTLPGAPSEGKLLAGDEILSVRESGRVHDGFTELHMSPWGPGRPGEPVEFKLRRGGTEIEVTILRGKVPAYEVNLDDLLEGQKTFYQTWPDHHEDIELIVDGGEYVAVLSLVGGTNAELGRGAFWASSSLYRLRDGKITEIRGVDDSLSLYKQLGYSVSEPGR